MADQRDDAIDHFRTTRPRAGVAMKDRREFPGLVLLGVAVMAVMVGVASAASGMNGLAIGAGVVVVVSAAAGLGWIFAARRRVNRIGRQPGIEPESPGAGGAEH